MKKFILFIQITLSLACYAEPEKHPEYIKICVQNKWFISISKKGAIFLKSMTDSHPLAMAHTKDKIVKFEDVEGIIKKHNQDLPLHIQEDKSENWVLFPEGSRKMNISEEIIAKIFEHTDEQWVFPGLSNRLKESLEKNPIINKDERQNKTFSNQDSIEKKGLTK